jgi:hypothetical protein
LGLTFYRLPTQYNSSSSSTSLAGLLKQYCLLKANASQPTKCQSISKKDLAALLALRRYGFDKCFVNNFIQYS